jgi:hypothetical protein
MNILIENNNTHEYLMSPGKWSKNPLEGKHFPATIVAFRAARLETVEKFNIVFHIPVKRQLLRDEFVQKESNGRTWVTTKQILAEEKQLIDFVRNGNGVCPALVGKNYQIQNPQLQTPQSAEQRAAVFHVLRSRDRVIAVRGGAGTGKTTMLKEAVIGIESAGQKVFAFAPSAEASRGVLQTQPPWLRCCTARKCRMRFTTASC